MVTLVIGDIHNHCQNIEHIIDSIPHDNVIFMGDYFDNWGDSPSAVEETAKWLKSSLEKPNRIHLIGNHDYHHMSHMTREYLGQCGHTDEKEKAINKILKREDWDKLKFFHVEQGWWFSHAGVTTQWFSDPIKGLTEEVVHARIEKELASGLLPLSLCAVDHKRGGRNKTGGLLWNDWSNMEVIEGVKQIVGHTPSERVRFKRDANAVCVDCMPYAFITIVDGNVNVHHRASTRVELSGYTGRGTPL